MTPSQYGEGRSLEHDRMQADVLEHLRKHMDGKEITYKYYGEEFVMQSVAVWPEVMLSAGKTVLGFVDILQKWQPRNAEEKLKSRGPTVYYLYEIKPRITTVGGLIRQMQAETALVERWHEQIGIAGGCKTRVFPVVKHDDPEVGLLRRLWHGPVLVWNAEERTLT